MALAMAAVAADPLRETGFRFVVQIHLEEGNLVEALRQYRTYADRLQQEIGAQPSSQLRQLIADHSVVPQPRSPVD